MVRDRLMLEALPLASVEFTLAISRGAFRSSPGASPVTARMDIEPRAPVRCWRANSNRLVVTGFGARYINTKWTGPSSPVSPIRAWSSDIMSRSRVYDVLVVGARGCGRTVLLNKLHGVDEEERTVRQHTLKVSTKRFRILYRLLDVDDDIGCNYAAKRFDAVLFVYDPGDPDTLRALAVEAQGLRFVDADMSRTILVGDGEPARAFVKDNRLGHFVGNLDTLREVLVATLGRSERRTDVIILGQSEEETEARSSRC